MHRLTSRRIKLSTTERLALIEKMAAPVIPGSVLGDALSNLGNTPRPPRPTEEQLRAEAADLRQRRLQVLLEVFEALDKRRERQGQTCQDPSPCPDPTL